MKFHRKLITCALCAAIGLSAIMGAGSLNVKAAGTTIKVNDSTATGRYAQRVRSDYGLRLGFGGSFNEIYLSMTTWGDDSASATLSLYAWNTNYDTTVASQPLVSERFDTLRDNDYHKLSFEALDSGEYFLRIHDVSGTVGVWAYSRINCGGFCYTNGAEGNGGWDMMVTFTERPAKAFYQLMPQTWTTENGIPEDSLYHQNEVKPDTWVFTDGLGRTSLTNADVGDPRDDKTLAMFYWTWHTTEVAKRGAVNTTELMEKYPDAKNDYDHEAWKNTGRYCFWNEPIYGYYTTEDPWVLRKQAELLANAGVDVIFADNSNGSETWSSCYEVLYPTWESAMNEGGVDVPKVSYLLPFGPNEGSKLQAEAIYKDIYEPGRYQDLWYYLDGKPMIMGYNTALPEGSLGETILNFFTWRAGQPGYRVESTRPEQWGWLSVYPQALYSAGGQAAIDAGQVDQMSVGVAVNHNYVTNEITAMNGKNVMGRSYTSTYPNRYEVEGKSASLWGYQFAEQFGYALEVDPSVIFVTGWNEWHAWRQPNPWHPNASPESQVNNALVDQFDDEYSRDLEPSKGALKDHYYYQLVNFARQYKGVDPIPTPTSSASIDIAAGQAQWKNVGPYFSSYANNIGDRNSTGYNDIKYTETSGRNDIIGAQIARDAEYVYFNVECASIITPYTDKLWMTIYIDSDQTSQGWETFDYVINKSAASENTVVLEKFTGNGYESVKVADCEYVLDGRYMTVKVAKKDLALIGDNFTINFSCTDNVHDEGDYNTFSGDIMDFYVSGDVAPGARFKYSYVSTDENTGEHASKDESAKSIVKPIIIGASAAVVAAGLATGAVLIVKKKKKA